MAAMTLKDGSVHGLLCTAVSGEITERADFSSLLAGTAATLVLDLGDVTRINSSGVRSWLGFVRQLEARGRRIVIERCAPSIVHQANLISDFLGRAEVRSALAPYFCARCNKDHLEEIENPRSFSSSGAVAEELPCPTCGAAMEFADLAREYLAFARDR
jgi:anti-anti-sigma regulatory factor